MELRSRNPGQGARKGARLEESVFHSYVLRQDIPAACRGEGDVLVGQANRVTAVVAQPFRWIGEPQRPAGEALAG